MTSIRIAVAGIGKIATEQHLPRIAANPAFTLVATVDPHQELPGAANFHSLDELLTSDIPVDALVICTPPVPRFEIARLALQSGLHVMLEKPPCATLNEIHVLTGLAREKQLSLFAAWHSREAAAVPDARLWLDDRAIASVAVTWHEDVRVLHPGQDWIWEGGGLGVFDGGINALSILTCLLPGRLLMRTADLEYPENCSTPLRAELSLVTTFGVPVSVSLDFLKEGARQWDIDIATSGEQLRLSKGGAEWQTSGGALELPLDDEYTRLYARFQQLVEKCEIDCDAEPLRLVADAFLCGSRRTVAPFAY